MKDYISKKLDEFLIHKAEKLMANCPSNARWTFEVLHNGYVLIPESIVSCKSIPSIDNNSFPIYDINNESKSYFHGKNYWNPLELTYFVTNENDVGHMIQQNLDEFVMIHHCEGVLSYWLNGKLTRTWELKNLLPHSIDGTGKTLRVSFMFSEAIVTEYD